MIFGRKSSSRWLAVIAILAVLSGVAGADIVLPGNLLSPQAVTASRDGTLYVGTRSGIVRIGSAGDIKESLPFGSIKSFVFDDRLQAVWACVPQTDSAARLQLIDARSGMVRSDYLLNDNGDCADATVGRDGTLYALDQANMRVLRIKRGDAGPSVWLSGDASAGSGYRWSALSVDNMGGIFLLSHAQGRLQRVAVRWDGSAGLPVEICLPRPLRSPVAIKPMAKRKLLVTEASGDLTLIAVMGEAGTLTTLASTITGPGNIAVVNGTAYVAESQSTQRDAYSLQPFRLVSVPLPSL